MSQVHTTHPEHHEPPHVGGDALAPGTILRRIQFPALIAGAAGLVLLLIGLLVDSQHFFRSYLYAYMFWVGLPLGCAALLMLQHMTGGTWGLIGRRFFEAGTRMLPLMAVLFIPVLIGVHHIYVWDNPDLAHAAHHEDEAHHGDEGAGDPLKAHLATDEPIAADVPALPGSLHAPATQSATAPVDTRLEGAGEGHAEGHGSGFKDWWLSRGNFTVRAVLYFLVWIAITLMLNKWSAEQDRVDDLRIARRMQLFSGPGVLLLGVTVTLAVFDWVMSIDPHWYSTLYGMLFIVGQALSALALLVLMIALLSGHYPFTEVLTRGLLNDLGNLMLAFVMLWAYLSFSQFLIIWSGNIAEETPYYVYRTTSGWQYVALFLIVCHWFLPFCILLSRYSKRNVRTLGTLAAVILVMRFVDLLWVILPKFAQVQGHHMTNPADGTTGVGLKNFWMYLAAPVGLGGIWLFAYIWQLKQRPILPPNDPRLEELHAVAAHGGAH